MDDDELQSDAESVNGETDDEFDMNSEEDNDSGSLNIVKDPNSCDDDIDPAVLFAKSFEKKRKSQHSGVQKRTAKFQSIRNAKGKSTVGGSTSDRAGSRCNSKYFGEVIRKLDERKRKIIKDHGFGILLQYDGCSVPRGFVQWLADQVDVNCADLVVGDKIIPFSAESVHLFLGIPIGGEDISQQHDDSAKYRFLKKINETSLPPTKTFATMLLGNTLSDDDVFRYFMVVALSTFLCPNSNTLPSPKYLGALIDVSTVKDWDWSRFVFEWLFASISTYRKRHRNTIGGCIYFFAGYYLDFLNFGSRHQLPPILPRIRCWKGSMINRYASYDCVSADKFGKRPVESIEETCYAESSLLVDICAFFRDSLNSDCYFFNEKTRDAMCAIFREHHTTNGFRSPGKLVISMVKHMYERYGHREIDDDPVPENSDARIPSPANTSEEDVDPMGHEHEAPMPAGSTHTIAEDVLDPTMTAGTTNTTVKDVDPAAANNTIVEDAIPTTTKINEEEFSVTEKIESDGLYNGSGSENCGVSQATEIIPSKNSSALDSGRRNRKRPDVMWRHQYERRPRARNVAKKAEVASKEASVMDCSGDGGTIEEASVLTSKASTKRQKLQLTAVESTSGAVGPSMDQIEKSLGETLSAESAASASDGTGQASVEKPCVKKTPDFFDVHFLSSESDLPDIYLLKDEDLVA